MLLFLLLQRGNWAMERFTNSPTGQASQAAHAFHHLTVWEKFFYPRTVQVLNQSPNRVRGQHGREEWPWPTFHTRLPSPKRFALPSIVVGGSRLDTKAGPPSMMNWVLAELRGSSSQDSAAVCGPHLNLIIFRIQSLVLEERELLSSGVLEQEG